MSFLFPARCSKNGTNSAGRTRYRCKACGRSYTAKQAPGKTRARQIQEHVEFYTARASSQPHLSVSRSTWDRQHAWCWHYIPAAPQTGEVHEQIIIDGKYLPHDWCVLIAYSGKYVIDWQFCVRENKEAYLALLQRIPAPDMVATDGSSGALGAIKQAWPHTKVQRCLFHLYQNTITNTTCKPRTPIHKALLGLADLLKKVKDPDQAIHFLKLLDSFYTHYRRDLYHRTYKKDVPASRRPAFVRPNQTWWYTHRDARNAYFRLANLAKNHQLFAFLDHQPPLSKTTSAVESINAALQDLMHRHRDLHEAHAPYVISWKLYQLTEAAKPPGELIKTMNPSPAINQQEPCRPTHATNVILINKATTKTPDSTSTKDGQEDHNPPKTTPPQQQCRR